MATNTSLITQITGQAWMRDADGSLKPLQQGMRIPVDAVVVTATGASVQLQVDGQPPITIGENRDVKVGAEIAQTQVDPATAAVAVPAEPDAARVLAAIDAGKDPLNELDPTAAVVQGGTDGDGGSSFTRLLSVLETTVPLSLEYPRPTYPTTEEVRLGGTGSNRAPEAIGGGLPGTGLLDQLNDDSDVVTPVNVGEKFIDPDGHSLTFTATGLPPGLTLDPITGIITGTLDSSASQGGVNGSGVYNVVITATDPFGASTSLDFTWTTNNPPPVAQDDSATTTENAVVTGNVLGGNDQTGVGRDTDPDGDKLTVTEITNGKGDKVQAGSSIAGENSDGDKGGGSFIINPDGSYSFNPGSDFDYLAVGESTTTTVTYKISDGDGGFDDATLTITVTGTNDVPIILPVGAENGAATVTEVKDLDPTENKITHTKAGEIKFTDADDSDKHDVGFTPNKPGYLGDFALTVNDGNVINWEFSVEDSAIDYLAAGETVTQEYAISIDDGKGGKVNQTVTITIVGTNDAPVINDETSVATGAVTEDASISTATGKLEWDDVDNRDTHTWTVKDEGKYGDLTINDNGEWTYTLDNAKADHLPAGTTITDTITVEVDDGNGGTDTKEIVITITGTNDVPVIDGSTVAQGTVKEAGYEVAGTPAVSGQLVATDVDDGDVLAWSLVDGDGNDVLTLKGEYGSITLDPTTNTWTYTLDNDADVTQKLNVGDSKVETFKAYVSDGKGGVVEQEIKVTVQGTNDAPVANVDVDTVIESGVQPNGNTPEAGKPEANGNVLENDTDIDSEKVVLKVSDVSFGGTKAMAGSGLAGTYGTLTVQPDGSYKYVLHNDDDNVQSLRAGQTATETFTYTVVDDHGGKHQATLTITVTGTNDVPVITTAAGQNEGSVTEQGVGAEDAVSTVTGELTATDVDVDHALTWDLQAKDGQTVTAGTDAAGQKTTTIDGKYGVLTLGADGKWTYTLDNTRPATQALKQGDAPTETFTARVQDEHGAWAEQEIKVTVQGTNDAPVASADADTVIESGVQLGGNTAEAGKAEANGNVLTNDTDIDSAKTDLRVSDVSFGGTTATASEGLAGAYGTLTVQPDGSYTYVLHNNDDNVQSLKAGQTATETFTYTVVDDHGGKHQATLTITVTGTNDVPVITSGDEDAQGAVIEAGHNPDGSPNSGSAIASGTLTSSDVDVDATATWSIQGIGVYGTIAIDPKTGAWTYTLDNNREATQALKDGQKETETFTARVQDEHGAWAEQVITVTVSGTNDAPTASGESVTFKEDPTEGAKGNAKIGNVLTNDHNHEDGQLTVKEFTIEGNVDGAGNLIKYPGGSGAVAIEGVGSFVLNQDGSYVFTPKPNYSGSVPKITYTVQEPSGDGEAGLTASADLQFTITPVADAPDMIEPGATVTPEDISIALGLKAPEVTDKIDHNGAGEGDNPELLGPITLTGIPAGVQLLDSNGTVLFTSDGTAITIVLSNPADGNGHVSGAAGTLTLTKEQFESLKVLPSAHDGNNFMVKVSVDSYEVGADGKPLPGIPSANTTVDVLVDVQAVTDKVELAFNDDSEDKSFTMNEDGKFNLTNELKAAFEDLDGSEQRDIVISGLPDGSTVFVGDKAITADSSGNFTIKATSQTGGIDSFPKIEIRPPANFSGDIKDITVTLNAQDTDKDSSHVIAGEADSVTLDLHIKPIAGDVSVGSVSGKEDTAINFLANVQLTDTDGSETITKFVIKGVPDDWVIRDADGNIVAPDADSNYVLSATGTPPVINLDAYKGWTATPPAHSSHDASFTLNIETTDVNPATGEISIVDKDYTLDIIVTPDAEKIGGDTDNDTAPDLTMTPGHTYGEQVAGGEDEWFALNVTDQGAGKDFNLQDGWSNQDGAMPDGSENEESADGGTEQTFALLKPVIVDGDSAAGQTAEGAQFSYVNANGVEVILTYNGKDPVEIPMEFLNTVKFKAPANVSGEFKIEVQAKTVDTDPDTGATSEAISGGATLDGIFIAPVADKVTLAVGGVDGRAQGDEDTAIGLSIRPTSSDPSETFNVKISDIPKDAVLMYDGVAVDVIDGVAIIPNFDSTKPLTVTPPLNSNEDFKLKVEAQSVDASPGGATSESAWQMQDLHVRVDGVADAAEVTFKNDVTFTEADLDAGGAITLSDIIATATLTDIDGSETLTLKITGLPDGFTVEGASFLGGTGEGREWVFTKDQLGQVKIKVPEHYSGKLPGELMAITTENDGHSLTGQSLKWDVDITPSPESVLETGSTIVEDHRSKLDFSIANNYGDTNEELTAVWIKVGDVEGKDFTLYLGDKTLAEAGVAKVTKDGVEYYELRGSDIDNVYAQAGDNFAHNKPDAPELSFGIKYEITDHSNDASQTPVAVEKDGDHTLTVTPVTDEVGLTVGVVTGDGVTGDLASGFTLTKTGNVSVDITLVKQPDAAAGGNADIDGSEQFTQVVITGVPDGMLVDGLAVGGQNLGNVSYLGDGKWVISIPNDQYPQFTGAIDGSVQFSAGDQLSGSLKNHPITITVVTQDNGADSTKADSVEWNLSTDFDGEGDEQPTVDVAWEQKPDFTGTEDEPFTLSDAFIGTVSEPNTTFTVVLTLPEGAKVTHNGTELTPTMVDGKEVWIISGKGDQAALDAFMESVVVTPPPNLNDNKGGLAFDATFTAHLPNGSQDQGKAEGSVPLTPVTDPAEIDVVFSAADADGNPTADPAQEGRDVAITLNVTSPFDGPTTLGDKLYIKLGEGDGLDGGTLKDANGNAVTLQTLGADNELGLAPGDYYVVDLPSGATAPHSVNLTYTPAEGQSYNKGSLAIDAWVQNQEHGATNVETGTGAGNDVLLGVNNGYDVTVGEQDGAGNWVVTGTENQNGGTEGRIQLNIGGVGLIDNDDSEAALVALLKNLPEGFLVYWGSDAGSAVLAGNAGVDANGNNVWNIPLGTDGKLPAYISVQPPQNWSGTLEGVHLSVLSGEKGQETSEESIAEFDVVVEAKADGILSLSPNLAFGKEGDIIQLNLNIVMADAKPAGDTDQSFETITLTLKGLGEHAAFYVGSALWNGVSYDADSDTYTISGLSQAQADKLGFIQAAGATEDKVTITAETTESIGGDTSEPITAEFDLSIFDKPATGGDDVLLYSGDLLDGGAGDDTVWLRFGEDLDFADANTPVNLKNIETLDLTKPGYDHELLNLSADEVLRITDGRNTLTIDADEGDKLSFKDNDGWTLDDSTDDYDVYTAKSSNGTDVEVHITKGLQVDGLLSDGQESLDGLLGGAGSQASTVTTHSAAPAVAEQASVLESLGGDQQNQLVNDLIQQGKLTTDV